MALNVFTICPGSIIQRLKVPKTFIMRGVLFDKAYVKLRCDEQFCQFLPPVRTYFGTLAAEINVRSTRSPDTVSGAVRRHSVVRRHLNEVLLSDPLT